MARILFTVCGIGMGHAGRSAMIINYLKKKHQVKVLSYGAGEKFLKSNFRVEKLEWFKMFFKRDRYKPDATLLHNLPKLPKVFFKNLVILTRIVEKFHPQVVISDFDANGVYIAKLFNIPSITISNMHITNFVKLDLKLKEKITYLLNHKAMLEAFTPTDYLFIVYPVKPQKEYKNVEFFHHLVRDEFLSIKPKTKDYFLVYSTPTQLEAIIPLLKEFPKEKFVVRGTKGKNKKNIVFRPSVSIKQFTKELSNCKGVICHGGLTIISEAITLKKPIYVFSDMQFFERYYNGKTVEKLGFGVVEETPTPKGLKKFISNIQIYHYELTEKNILPSNQEFLEKLEKLVLQLSFRPQKDLATRLKEVKKMLKEKNPKQVFKKIMKESDFKKFFKGDFKKFYKELMKEFGPEK